MGITSLFQNSTGANNPDGEGSTETPGHRGAFIGSTVRLVGALRSSHDVTVQGRVEGPLVVTGQVLVDGGGQVEGEIRANMIRVRGRTRGALLATEQVSLEVGSEHDGTVQAPELVVEEGARVDGDLKVGRGCVADEVPAGEAARPGNPLRTLA